MCIRDSTYVLLLYSAVCHLEYLRIFFHDPMGAGGVGYDRRVQQVAVILFRYILCGEAGTVCDSAFLLHVILG